MRKFVQYLLASALWIGATSAVSALPNVQAYGVRATTNGHVALVVDESTGRLKDFWLHLYKQFAPDQVTADVLFDAYFGLRIKGLPGKWMKSLPHPQPFACIDKKKPCVADFTVFGYIDQTGIVRDVRVYDQVHITVWYFAPQGLAQRAAVLLAEVRNLAPTPVEIDVAALLNFHTGTGSPEATATQEQIEAVSIRTLTEKAQNSPHRLLYRAIDGLASDSTATNALTPTSLEVDNPYAKFQDVSPFGSAKLSKQADDRVAGLLWSKLELAAEGSQMLGVLTLYEDQMPFAEMSAIADAWLNNRAPLKLLSDESAAWAQWHAAATQPSEISTENAKMLRQSLALLRMGQVLEFNIDPPNQGHSPNGQIVASLPPGMWNITWARDQAYAAVALAASGHVQEAILALKFVLNGQTGAFADVVGAAYLPTITRYFGGGLEETDSNSDGPNIEFDGFGLTLWQAWRTVQASGDLELLAQNWPVLRDNVVNPLVGLIDATGLIHADSSIWEVHWGGKQKHFAYTSLMAVRGLCSAAKLATLVGEGGNAAKYRKVAQQLRGAIAAKLVIDGILRGNAEEAPSAAIDAAAVEAFTDSILDPSSSVAAATWQAWQKKLKASDGGGFIRNDDGGEYDSKEWLFIDLRIARMLQRMGLSDKQWSDPAAKLLQRATDIAKSGGGIVPELIALQGENAGQFDGAVPMMGFGSAAMVLALGGEAYGDDWTTCLQPSEIASSAEGETGNDTAQAEPIWDGGMDDQVAVDARAAEISYDSATILDSAIAPLDAVAAVPAAAPVASNGCQSANFGDGASSILWALSGAILFWGRKRWGSWG